MDAVEIQRLQQQLTVDMRTFPQQAILNKYFMVEIDYDVVEMGQAHPGEVQHLLEYLEEAGIANITTRLHRHFYPRLVRLFYDTIRKDGERYLFSWDGITYELTEELIGRALRISHTHPEWSSLHPHDPAILYKEDTVQWFGEFPADIPYESKLLDHILFTNAWNVGKYEKRSGEMLEADHNIIQGNWVSPSALIFKSLTKDVGTYLRLPLTVEAIRKTLGHPVFTDETLTGRMITCGRRWIETFLGEPFGTPDAASQDVIAPIAQATTDTAADNSAAMLRLALRAIGPMMQTIGRTESAILKCAEHTLPPAEYDSLRMQSRDEARDYYYAQQSVFDFLSQEKEKEDGKPRAVPEW